MSPLRIDIPIKYKRNFKPGRALKIYANGKRVKQLRFEGVRMSPAKIRELAQSISNQLAKQKFNGSVQIEMDLERGYRSGRFTKAGERVITYVDYYGEDPDEFVESFKIYIKTDPPREGGSDPNNDCLYNCLLKVDKTKVEKLWPTPGHFKKSFKLIRKGKFPISKISELEDKISMRIYITGDATYTSAKRWNGEIHLILENEHYELFVRKRKYIPYLSRYEKQVVLILERKSIVYAYIKGKIEEWTFEELLEHRKKYVTSKYVIHEIEKFLTSKEIDDNDLNKTFTEAYKKFQDMAQQLKDATNGEINLYKGTFKQVALNLWSKFIIQYIPDNITPIEQMWLKKASRGATIWCKNYEGPCYKYDFISEYPSILIDNGFDIPIRKGIFKKMSQEEFDNLKFFNYGIY